jgi:hypothetical protein
MTESPYPVGYGRPPKHTRFQKGKSGNPGGKPGPKKRLKHRLDVALSDALDGDRWELRDAKPRRVIDAFARKVVLDALEGRGSAQRLVLAILDGEEGGAAEESGGEDLDVSIPRSPGGDGQARGECEGAIAEESRGGADEESEEDDEEAGDEDPFVFEDEDARRVLGDRYDEFKTRFERAMNEGDAEAFVDLAADFGDTRFDAAGNVRENSLSEGVSKKAGVDSRGGAEAPQKTYR